MSLPESIWLMALVISYSVTFVTSCYPHPCASVCRCICTDDVLAVECTGKNLHQIPSPLPTNTSVINLSNNRLKTIPAMAFRKFRYLNVLRIDFNQLNSVHANAFRGLTYLVELSLENNNLMLLERVFVSYMFVDQVRLKRLKLRGNNHFTGDYLDNTIPKVRSLESLYIVGFGNKVFGPQYKKLNRLQFLDFSVHDNSPYMHNISADTFENVPRLTYLNLSNCGIEIIPKKTFSYLSSLKILDLSYNRRLTFLGLRDALYGLKDTSLEILHINAIHSIFGLGTAFTEADAVNLQKTFIKTLNLDSNKIEFFEDGALSRFPTTLETLSIRDNRFTFGWYIFKMYQLPSIRVIDFSFSSTQHSIPVLFSQKNTVNNNISLPNSSLIMLKEIYLQQSYLRYPLPKLNMGTQTRVRIINASVNLFCPWKGPMKGLENLTILDLSNNMCSYVLGVFFTHFYSLSKLYLQNNLLGLSSNLKGFKTLFQNNTRLKELRLSNNRITSMSNSSLSNNVDMHYLDLSHNYLKSFSVKIGRMRNLGVLDLSGNFLAALSMETIKDIQNISRTKKITVNLKGNALKCTCGRILFFKWMLKIKQSKRIYLLYDKCTLPNETAVSLKGEDLARVIEFLDKSCSSLMSLITVSTIAMLVLVVLLLSGFVYRYRWNLRYFYYMIKQRYVQEAVDVANYAFDAFVSYAEEESEFVINEMLPELEVDGNLRLNIHQRDFVPGRQIVENILSAIQQSKFCLVLLSSNFLRSRWCMYEFSMSKMETVYTGRDMVVVVMLEEIDPKTIPLELIHHLKTNSYIQYPTGDEQAQRHFWNHIKGLLQRVEERV